MDIDFYENFYAENRVRLLQYDSLRNHFSLMIKNVLGDDYYNMAMDVYEADRLCCEDITRKANKSIVERLFQRKMEKLNKKLGPDQHFGGLITDPLPGRLRALEERMSKIESKWLELEKNMKPLDPEYSKVVDNHFWELK